MAINELLIDTTFDPPSFRRTIPLRYNTRTVVRLYTLIGSLYRWGCCGTGTMQYNIINRCSDSDFSCKIKAIMSTQLLCVCCSDAATDFYSLAMVFF